MIAQQLTTRPPDINIIPPPARLEIDELLWLNYWSPELAYEHLLNRVKKHKGYRYERHCMRAYLSSFADFCLFLGAQVVYDRDRDKGEEDAQGIIHPRFEDRYQFDFSTMRMPTTVHVDRYILHLRKRGLSARTIVRYIVPIRHFARGLLDQLVFPRTTDDLFLLPTLTQSFQRVANIEDIRDDFSSTRPPLEQYGKRLTLRQVNTFFEYLDDEARTLSGRRDYALIYLGITTGLRASELARLTLANITRGDNCYEIRVRGKNANRDPIGMDDLAYDLIQFFVGSWNDELDPGDPRHIGPETPIFQPLLRGDHIPPVGPRYKPQKAGLSSRALLKIVTRRSQDALKLRIGAHDMRRTFAYLLRNSGVAIDTISAKMRHAKIDTTQGYIGKPQDLAEGMFSKVMQLYRPCNIRRAAQEDQPYDHS